MKRSRQVLPLMALMLVATLTPPGDAHKRISAEGRVMPHWVRYPFEFQLCGIALGTVAVDRDPVNKIERYSLFFVHGNPTAVVSPGIGGVTAAQAPPGSGTPILEIGAGAPWIGAIEIDIPPGHVQWLYRREGFAMGFVVDPIGFVTAITVSGDSSPIAATQMGDPYHTVKLGDDFRKVLFRYGYPDMITVFVPSGGGAGGGPGGEGELGGGGSLGIGPGGGGAGPSGSLLPSRERYVKHPDIQALNRALVSLPGLESRTSARVGQPKGRTSAKKVIPPLPPARLEVRVSGQAGPMPGGAMGGPSGMAGGPGGMMGGPGASGLGGFGGGAFGGAGEGFEGGGEAGPIGAAGGNAAFATYQLDYRDTYNVIFTIRNNRVVRIFIWGDPDYFNDRNRRQMRDRL